ncbi:WxL domain-containing protein, partial [Enterococcus faecalis]|uniref:WxL domain-containing protein n=6 Tax=Enterococcus TaxID=1350 RepID=UPI0023083643
MKQTKWQRLATIGLCSSLVINAFSGVTAVAETITIESSPTVASSAKEATSASSATPESTESSQETTETSREEVTQETEKQAEIPEVKTETTESVPENSSENDLQKSISPRWVPNNQVIYPRMTFAFTDETGKAFTDETLTLSGTYFKLTYHVEAKQWRPYADRYPIVSSNVGGGYYRVAVNAAVPLPYNFFTDLSTGYIYKVYAPEQLKINNTLKYVDNIVAPPSSITLTKYTAQQVSETAQFGNYTKDGLLQRDRTFSKNSANIFSLNSVALAPSINDVLKIMQVSSVGTNQPVLFGFDGTTMYRETLNYVVTRKQVTEKFVDTNGVAITPPTGFTQNKKTPMTSNNYTFKQAGTLPDTYQADGKTYKFKGWYKGKTKTNTLTTTKAPSYAVTYDGNDDLNVVYEEVVPRDTWVYPGFYAEFVDEQGKAFTNPLTFSGNYTQFLRKKIVNIFETTGNLYPMIGSKDPSQSNKYKIETQSRIPISATYDGNVTGDVYDKREYGLHDLTITNELKYVDKIEVMNTSLQAADYLVGYVGIDPILIDFPNILHPLERAFIKNTNQRFSINAIFGANGSASTIPRLLRIGGKDQPNQRNVTLMGFDGTTNYKHTMNYKVTRKQVTENFVDTNGTKITPPTGFTQNKKTPMTSNNYTFKQAGTLPDTYTTGGKTYKFKGWYKGKTKPNTLTTTKAPSYAVTYDDNDDLNVVYEEETVTTLYPSINMNFVNEKGGTFTPALTFSGKYYAQSTSASLRTDLYDVTSKNNGSGQYTVSINNGSMPLSQELLKKYNNGQPISATNRLRFNVDKLTINQQLKYVDTIQVDTAQSSSLNYYGHKYTSGSSTIFDPNIAPTEYNMTTEQINSLNFSSDGTYFSNANNRFFNMHLGYSSSGGSSLLMMALFNENPVNQTKLVYKVTRKQVTENFVDANGAKITAPTGFTQGNKIPMTSNTFKYTAAKALPATYTAGGKTYTFQGWYKGKTKPNTLTTSTTPTYNTTFDGNDDMTAMYKEVTAVYPGFYAQFVDEQGKAFTNPLTLSGNYTEFLRKTGTTVFETKGAFYPMVGKRDTTVTNKYKIETTSSVAVPNNYWTAMPADIANRGYALNNLDITNQMKYVDKIETTDTHTTMYDYTGVSDIGGKPNNTSQTELNPIDKTFVKQTDNTFAIKSIWGNGTFSHIVPKMLLLAESGSFSRLFGFDGTPDYKQTVNYKVTRKQVTENFVDTNGTKITPPTGFTQGNKIPMTSNTFKYTAAKALPATYTAGGKTYTFQGWYKGKTKPNTLTTSTTPTYNTTFDGNDDMTAMYKEEVPKASVALTRTTAETVTSGGNVTWRATITNTSQAPLTTATIKKSTAWTTGLAAPTAMIVTPAGGTAKTVPVTATTWTNGVSLGTDIPVGKSATVQFTTKATGTAGQVLRAGITTSGNYSGVSTSATVRVKDNDQAIVTPTAEGFISVPTFNFGQVDVASATKQHGLKKAADYYGNGTRNPYLRIKKTQPNWSLTAQLSQPKSATDSLPTATRLLLGAAPV